MRRLVRSLMHYLYKPLLKRYLDRDLKWRFNGLRLSIKKGVFHPAFFGSTKVFAAFLKSQEWKGKSVLEVGCGSGLLSIIAATGGANVTALDINPDAVETTRHNAAGHQLNIQVLQSDIFDGLTAQPFDVILTNPPFFPADPKNDAAFAWYAGSAFEFFQRFFAGLCNFIHSESRIWMILSEICDLDRIREIAEKQGWALKKIDRRDRLFETFVVWEIEPIQNTAVHLNEICS